MRTKADINTISCFPLDHNKFMEAVCCQNVYGKMSSHELNISIFHIGLDILKIFYHFFFNNNLRDPMIIALGTRTHAGEKFVGEIYRWWQISIQ